MTTMIWVGLGAGLGAACRYGITVLGKLVSPTIPYATILINVIGSSGRILDWQSATGNLGAIFTDWGLRWLYHVFNVFRRYVCAGSQPSVSACRLVLAWDGCLRCVGRGLRFVVGYAFLVNVFYNELDIKEVFSIMAGVTYQPSWTCTHDGLSAIRSQKRWLLI